MSEKRSPTLPELNEIGTLADESIPLAEAALALSNSHRNGRSMQRYSHHLDLLGTQVADRYMTLLNAGARDVATTCLAALKHVLSDVHAYHGNKHDYDNLDNADLACVIDNSKGLPIALAILYIHAGRAQGWSIDALNMPGHVLCRIEHNAERVIFDPFESCKMMEAQDIRALLKRLLGESAELSASYFEPTSRRDILIRLQNNIKLRQIEGEDYAEALVTVEDMMKIAPDEYRLDLDAGVLYAKTEQPLAATRHLERYIDVAPEHRDRQEAALLLRHIREQLH